MLKKRKSIFFFVFIAFVIALCTLALAFTAPPLSEAPITALVTDEPAAYTPPPVISTPTPTPTPEPDFSTREIKIQMAGDILLHTGPVRAARTGDGYDFSPYFSQIAPFLNGDLTICNMESPIDAYGDNQKLSSYPQFNVPYEILPALRDAGFNLLLTANNHAFDRGWTGVEATRRNMEKAGVDFTGTFETKEQFETPKILNVDGLMVGVLNYTDAVNGLEGLIPEDARPYTMRRFSSSGMDSVPAMAEDIHAIRTAGARFVIVAPHWGAEYTDDATQTQKQIARALCDAGADVVMGGHSHCVQPVELYEQSDGRKSLILYSLGNFFADQTSLKIAKTQYGMLVSAWVRLDKTGALVWEGVEILPTLTYRYADNSSPNGVGYRLLPSEPETAERPAIFQNDAEWSKARKAFDHVTKIVGSVDLSQ